MFSSNRKIVCTSKITWSLPLFVAAFIIATPGIQSYTATAAETTHLDFLLSGSAPYQDTVVDTVISTDTIKLESGEKIRLIGLKAIEPPEKERDEERDEFGFVKQEPAGPLTQIEELAFQFVQNLLEGQRVRLEFDVEKKDPEHRTLAYVFLKSDNTMANTEILRQGFAYLHISPPNTKYAAQLREAYQEARREQRGALGE